MPDEPPDAAPLLAQMREGFIRDGYEHRTLFGGTPPQPPIATPTVGPIELTRRLEELHELADAGLTRFRPLAGWGLTDTERARLLADTTINLDAWPHRDRQAVPLARTLREHGDPTSTRHQVALLWALTPDATMGTCEQALHGCADPAAAFHLLTALQAAPAPDLVRATLAAV